MRRTPTTPSRLMRGSTSSTDGGAGYAPKTLAGDEDLFLRGDGTFRSGDIPSNSKSADYTTVLRDAGKHVYHPASDNNARTFTIAANASVAYPIGTCITFVNRINTVTIAITSDTLIFSNDGTTGSRSLAAYGMATALKVEPTVWFISGIGLT